MNGSSESVLQHALSQPLRSVEGLFFTSSGASTTSLDHLDQLRITLGSSSFRFRCSSDGETLAVDESELCPSDLGEFGSLHKGDLSQDQIFSRFINSVLRKMFLLKSYEGKCVVGIILEFAAGLMVICNWGDELKVWDTVPNELFKDEGIQITPA